MKDEHNILLVGIGGQGVITLSNIIAYTFFKQGFDVKKSDAKGMSQRNAEVVSHIKIGKKIYSPIIKKKMVDILLGFDKKRVEDYKDYLNKNTKIIIANSNIILLKKISKLFNIKQEEWVKSIKRFIPEKYVEEEIKLFKK